MVKLEVRKNAYYDSVTLMLISKDIKKLPGVEEALVGMGTDLNREIAQNIGLDTPGLAHLGANDFFVAVRCGGEGDFAAATAMVEQLLTRKAETRAAVYAPPTLEGACKLDPALNLAVISVPGKYAAAVAQDCLERDLHVMLFSDNVTLEEELALKQYAAQRGLLVMGPDCGTAILSGTPLAFANVVRRGDIGMVAASGTGAQEISSLIHRRGGGLTQVIGTGGRDLSQKMGGIMMLQGLQALLDDPETRVIVLVSKPPAPEIATRVLNLAAQGGKPVVLCFLGGDPEEATRRELYAARSLEDAACKAVALSRGEPVTDAAPFQMGESAARALARDQARPMASCQHYLRGLYTGGTLCDEAMKLLGSRLGPIYSNIPLDPAYRLEDPKGGKSVQNTFLDFGDDAFTTGRPHPMIDPSLRAQRVLQEGDDPETAVLLVDCVIGYGSHPNPAEDLAEAVCAAKENARKDGRYLAVVASVCGTEEDPQCLSATREKLEAAGCIVLPSGAQAARFAALILDAREGI